MFAGPPPSDHASGRARQQQADRPLRGVFHRRDAAIGLHDPNHRLHAVGAEPQLQFSEIGRAFRADIGVHRGAGEALVFADRVHGLAGRAEKHVRKRRPDDFFRPKFMLVVEERKKEANNDSVHVTLGEQLRRLLDFVLRERNGDIAVGRHNPLSDDKAVAPPHQRLRLPGHVELQREVVRPLVPRHVQNVAEAAGRDHADFRAGTLDDHVGRNRCSMKNGVNRAGRHARQAADLQNSCDNALGLIPRRARHLGDGYLSLAIGHALEDNVGKRAADIDADPDHRNLSRARRTPHPATRQRPTAARSRDTDLANPAGDFAI